MYECENEIEVFVVNNETSYCSIYFYGRIDIEAVGAFTPPSLKILIKTPT